MNRIAQTLWGLADHAAEVLVLENRHPAWSALDDIKTELTKLALEAERIESREAQTDD